MREIVAIESNPQQTVGYPTRTFSRLPDSFFPFSRSRARDNTLP